MRVLDAGVVGQTPILSPGDSFQYYSSSEIDIPPGRMHGSFQMITTPSMLQPPGGRFDALISPFRLM